MPLLGEAQNPINTEFSIIVKHFQTKKWAYSFPV